MSLTAEDIQTKQFHVRFRGFDIEEVDTFLERVAENFALLNDEKRLLKEKVEKLEMEINEFYSQEKTFQHAIISAQRISDEMQEKSRKEAEARRAAAQEEIDRLRRQSAEEKQTLDQEIAALQQNKSKVKEELRTYLQTYLSWLDQDISLAENTPLSLLRADIMDGGQPLAAEAAEPAIHTEDAAVDEFDDLYEKIELPDELNPEEKEKMASALQENQSGELDEEDDRERLTIPDLEGDMLFALDDPLDEKEQEPGVDIEPPDDKYYEDMKLK
jgi:cell division initiation protein